MENIIYQTSQHSAYHTDDYLFSQLIPYIGNKRKLLPLINEAIEYTGVTGGLFADLFSGSGVVSRLGKIKGFQVFSNDWEPYAEIINTAYIACNTNPFHSEELRRNFFDELNTLEPVYGYLAKHYCPEDDDNPDVETERMFFTRKNGEKIDAIRGHIYTLETLGKISFQQKCYLIAALLYSVSYASNTSGVFKGFHNGWGGKTKTALYRILGELSLKAPVLYDNGKNNQVFRQDAQLIAEHVKNIDIAYCFTPDNLVRTYEENLIPIKDLKKGDRLHNDKIVLSTSSRRYTGNILNFKIQGTPTNLCVTPEHKIQCIPLIKKYNQDVRSDHEMWDSRCIKKAKDLRIGDYLLIPTDKFEQEQDWQDDCWQIEESNRVFYEPNKGLFKLFGYYLAEGHLAYYKDKNTPNSIIFSLNIKEKDTLAKEIVELFKSNFDFSPKISFQFSHRGVCQVIVNSVPIAKLFKKHCGSLSYKKQMSRDLMTAPVEYQIEILKGWLLGDGGLQKQSRNRNKLTGSTVCKNLSHQLFTLSLRCELKPSWKSRKNKTEKAREIYDIYFASEDILKLGYSVECNKFRSTRKIINSHLLVRIKEITATPYDGLVYDIDVDKDDLFAVPYVLAHNCDPPYNQHPYGSNYHILNTVALWDTPEISRSITAGNKSAIRTDWRTERRSAYNHKDALEAYDNIVNTLKSHFVLTSYSTDGLIPLEDMVETCCNVGEVSVVLKPYKRYRVSTQRYSEKSHNVEFILTVDKHKKSLNNKDEIISKIRKAE